MTIEEKFKTLIGAHPWLGVFALSKRLSDVVVENTSLKVKRQKIIRIANDVGQALEPLVACRVGCSHCCRTTTIIYEHEAELLAKVSDRKLTRLAWRPPEEIYREADHTGKACPFLTDDVCSAYDHRPFHCRIRHSLNDRADDCAKVGTGEVKVNMLSPEILEASYIEVNFSKNPEEPWRNIHDFFPGDAC